MKLPKRKTLLAVLTALVAAAGVGCQKKEEDAEKPPVVEAPQAAFSKAKALAAERSVPLLVSFHSEGSGSCVKFARDARENAPLRKALEQVVFFQADVDRESGEEIADEYRVEVTPSFFLLDANGAPLDRWKGYWQPSDWLFQFEGAISDLTTIQAKAERLATAPSERLAAALGRIRSAEYKPKEAVQHYRMAQKLAREPDPWYANAIFVEVSSGLERKEFTLADVRAAANAVFAQNPGDDLHRAFTGSAMANLATERKDPTLLTPYLAPAVQAAERSTDPDARRARTDLLVAEALVLQKIPAKAFAVKRDAMPPGWEDDAAELNDLARWCLESDVNIEAGEALARRALDLAEEATVAAEVLDTLAEITGKLGNYEESVDLLTEATEIAPQNEHYKEELARFREIVDKKPRAEAPAAAPAPPGVTDPPGG